MYTINKSVKHILCVVVLLFFCHQRAMCANVGKRVEALVCILYIICMYVRVIMLIYKLYISKHAYKHL